MKWGLIINLFAFVNSTSIGYIYIYIYFSLFNLKRLPIMNWSSVNMLLTSGGSLVTLSSNYSLKDNIHVTIDFMKLVTIIITVVVIVVVSAII